MPGHTSRGHGDSLLSSGIPYGEHHFCKETIHIEVLFKAARYYWDNIMGDHKRRERWSSLPQARYLFNSPYHGAAPQTSVERVRKIIHHITCCGTGRCSCNILELHEQGSTGNRAVKAISLSSTGSLSKLKMSSTDLSRQQECIITKVVRGARVLRQETFKTPAVRPSVNPTAHILSFHEDTSDWGQLDAKCSTEHDVSHHVDESDPTSYSLLTSELQDLRSGMIGCEVVHRYFSILCPSSVNVNVQHLHPAFTSLMAGLVTDSGVDIHEVFEDRHLLCDWLLCPLVHDTHISFVTIIYGTCTMIHEDSLCGIHNSKRIFQGMAKFFRNHIAWRRERNRPLRNGLTRVTRWHTIEATPTTTAQQGDGISCGILMCGNATCRVQGMPGFSCGQIYVPQLRLHIYHCIMRSTFFSIMLSPTTSELMERTSRTKAWYEHNKSQYTVILNVRRTRPLPQPTALTGRGTTDEPFELDQDTASTANRGKRSRDIIQLDVNDEESIDSIHTLITLPTAGTTRAHFEESRKCRPQPREIVEISDNEQVSTTRAVSTIPELAKPIVRRLAFRAGDRSTLYAAKCRRARLAQTILQVETSLSSSVSQSTDALPSMSERRDTTDLTTLPSDHQLCLQPVSEEPSPSGATATRRKRGRDVQEVVLSHPETTQAPTQRDKKRKFTRRKNLGYARQKTTMDSFVSRLKDVPGDREAAAGGSAAIGVVSNTSLVIQHVNDSVMPVEHVELIGQIEHDYSSEVSPPKRARKAQKAAHSSASSTLLEYDKRIADS